MMFFKKRNPAPPLELLYNKWLELDEATKITTQN
jgi:hypothetical protein